jgi:hypothetical protein
MLEASLVSRIFEDSLHFILAQILVKMHRANGTMTSRSRSPDPQRQLAILAGPAAMACPSSPCPWCILGMMHNATFDEVANQLRVRMAEWSNTGCSSLQLGIAVFAFEWILLHHQQRPYGPVQQPMAIASVRGERVFSLANHFKFCVEVVDNWSRAPPPPPVATEPGQRHSSAAASHSSSSWLSGDIGGDNFHPDSNRGVWRSHHSPDEEEETLPEVHPHFQWQAGSSKKTWRSFEEPFQTQMRCAYQNGEEGFRIVWSDEHPYTDIKFPTMEQKNVETGFIRKIRIKP